MLCLVEQALFWQRKGILLAKQIVQFLSLEESQKSIITYYIDIQIEMFLKTVKPILLYACEICGHGNVDILEQVQLKFLKSILNLKNSTPIGLFMVKLEFCPSKLIYRLALFHFGPDLFFLCLTIDHLYCMRYLYLLS